MSASPLSAAEQDDLARQWSGLALWWAKKRWPGVKGADLDDLVGELSLGIVRAARTFDPGRGCHFKTHAYWQMRRAAVEWLRTAQPPFARLSVDPAGPDPFGPIDDREEISVAIRSLNARQRRVIEMRFYEDKTLDEVGAELGVVRERARQIEARALARMRRRLKGQEEEGCP